MCRWRRMRCNRRGICRILIYNQGGSPRWWRWVTNTVRNCIYRCTQNCFIGIQSVTVVYDDKWATRRKGNELSLLLLLVGWRCPKILEWLLCGLNKMLILIMLLRLLLWISIACRPGHWWWFLGDDKGDFLLDLRDFSDVWCYLSRSLTRDYLCILDRLRQFHSCSHLTIRRYCLLPPMVSNCKTIRINEHWHKQRAFTRFAIFFQIFAGSAERGTENFHNLKGEPHSNLIFLSYATPAFSFSTKLSQRLD